MWIGVISLFPEMFSAFSDFGVSGRALSQQAMTIEYWNPRDFTEDKHQTVDDRPFGGGPGMVMKVEPLYKALLSAKVAAAEKGHKPKVVYLSPQGRVLKQADIESSSQLESLILIAGRYEGIDERFVEAFVDEEWSIGDYVLSGGELPAMVVLDAIARQLPQVLGHEDSSKQDSFSAEIEGLLDCPHYTRPEALVLEDIEQDHRGVPAVLLSGNHEAIRQWRLVQSLKRTRERRPDLLSELRLSKEADELLEKIERETLEKGE